jgi:hypothetical protein
VGGTGLGGGGGAGWAAFVGGLGVDWTGITDSSLACLLAGSPEDTPPLAMYTIIFMAATLVVLEVRWTPSPAQMLVPSTVVISCKVRGTRADQRTPEYLISGIRRPLACSGGISMALFGSGNFSQKIRILPVSGGCGLWRGLPQHFSPGSVFPFYMRRISNGLGSIRVGAAIWHSP